MFKSQFIEMFGDVKNNPKQFKQRKLGDVVEVGSSKRVFVNELQKEGVPFYRGTEIGLLATKEHFIPELYITNEHYLALKQASGVPVPGDLLMPSICPDGRIWQVESEAPFYFKDGRVLWIHLLDNSFDSTFLKYALKNLIVDDYDSIASGTTFVELKIFSLKGLKMIMPDIQLQRQFSAMVAQSDKSKYLSKELLLPSKMNCGFCQMLYNII